MTDAGLGLDPSLVTFHMHFAKNWSGSETTTANVLPHSASIRVGDTVTATVALTNTDVASAADCFVAPLTSLPATFSYRAIDATGAPIAPMNSPVSVRGNGGVLNFTISITLTAPIVTTDVQFNIGCASTTNAAPVSGVNTLLLVTDYTSNDTPNYQGLWWASPAGSEAGWGINFAHQGDVIFATWFTYDTTGKAWWLGMQANQTAPGVYAGTIFTTHGPAFNAVPFNPALVTETPVGSGTLTFSDANDASFAYTVNGVSQTKALLREVFASPVPVCTFGGMSNLAQATNYQDLWWASPGGVESGWGVNLTQQGEVIFATWFTYDGNGNPLWLSGPALKTSAGVYTGTLSRTTGPGFNAVPFDPSKVTETPVGTLTLSFSDGANGTFAYTVNGVSQVKAITREVFVSPGTACQ